jgi:hypothetical protein
LDAKVTSVIPTDIETDDFMPTRLHKRHEYRSDVAAIAVNEDSHRDLLRRRRCPLRRLLSGHRAPIVNYP